MRGSTPQTPSMSHWGLLECFAKDHWCVTGVDSCDLKWAPVRDATGGSRQKFVVKLITPCICRQLQGMSLLWSSPLDNCSQRNINSTDYCTPATQDDFHGHSTTSHTRDSMTQGYIPPLIRLAPCRGDKKKAQGRYYQLRTGAGEGQRRQRVSDCQTLS